GIACRHPAFDEVFRASVTHFVELTKSPNLPCGDALFTAHSLCLLVVSIRNAFLHEHATCLDNGRFPARSYHCRIKDMFFWQPRKVAMFFGHKAPGFLCRNVPE